MCTKKWFLCLLAVLFLGEQAMAEDKTTFVIDIGTMGAGAAYVLPVNEHINARLGLHGWQYSETVTKSGVRYDADLELKSASAIADFHPLRGLLRLSGGIVFNGNNFSLTGQPSAGTFNFNGVLYPAAQVGSATGSVDFNTLSPYLGIGLGNSPKGHHSLSIALDLGAVYQGSPNVGLSVSCGSGLPASICSKLQSDAAAEARQLEDSVKNYQWWPVIALGIAFRF